MSESHEQAGSRDSESISNQNDESSLSFDRILTEIGEFGPYQFIVAVSTGFALLITTFSLFNFVFSSAVPDHRCLIPECEHPNSVNFDTDWLRNAIPYKDDHPKHCYRYEFIESEEDSSVDTCSENQFNRSNVIHCDNFIIRSNEDRLVSRLNLLCKGDEDKLALIGTASTIGRFVAMPVSGIASDKFGRLITIIGGLLLGSTFSCLQVLPATIMSFELYLVLEFFAALSTAGVLGTCFVYNAEWVTAKHRIYLNVLTSFTNAFGYSGIGIAAWYFENDFVGYKLVLAIPGFLVFFLCFILGESPRWLLARHKYERAIKSIEHAGKINNRPPFAKTIQQIRSQSMDDANVTLTGDKQHNEVTIRNVLKHKMLTLRLLILSVVWLFSLFAYYGVILGSVRIHDNKYFSYIIVGLAEIPSAIINIIMLDRVGRRLTIGVPLLIYGLTLGISTQLAGQQLYQLILFIVSKTAIATTLIALCTYTTELWPTAIRNTAFNICSMAGRVGSIFASLSVLLVKYYFHLPAILYGSVTIVSAVLLFAFLPETVNCKKLPDTIDEAIAIGKSRREVREDRRNSRELHSNTL